MSRRLLLCLMALSLFSAGHGCAQGVTAPFDDLDSLTTSEDAGASRGGSGEPGGAAGSGGVSGSGATLGGGSAGTSVGGGGAMSGGGAGMVGGAGMAGTAGMAGEPPTVEPDAGMPGPTVTPTGITVSPGGASGLQAPSVGGSAFANDCADGHVLIGYQGTVDAPGGDATYLRSFQGICASLSVSGSGPFEVSIQEEETLVSTGDTPGPTAMGPFVCPAGNVIVGFGGRAGGFIDQLVFHCAPLIIEEGSSDYTLTVGTATSLGDYVGGPGGSSFGVRLCPTGQIAIGDEGFAGGAIDAFGLLCGSPSLLLE